MEFLKIKNANELSKNDLRLAALSIAETGLQAIDTENVIRENIRLHDNVLQVKDYNLDLCDIDRIFVIGVGKCSFDAAKALEEVLGDRIHKGMVIDVKGGGENLKHIKTFEGDHPFPTDRNVDLTSQMISILHGVTEKDLVLAIISGGGSTMLCQPLNFTCFDERQVLDCLFRGGANIEEINTIRKHLSLARGGFLAKHAHPARLFGLVFSDVVGNELEYVASGPTVLDTTTVEDAILIAEKYGVSDRCSFSSENLIETPKDDSCFAKVTNILLVSNTLALEAMNSKAKSLGFNSSIKSSEMFGEASVVGRNIVSDIRNEKPKTALIYGGETVVRIRGAGKGGRNRELVLSALKDIENGECVLAIASDGRDNGDNAGAMCDIISKEKANSLGLVADDFLVNNNSGAFFEKVGDFIETGVTGSNIADFVIALKE